MAGKLSAGIYHDGLCAALRRTNKLAEALIQIMKFNNCVCASESLIPEPQKWNLLRCISTLRLELQLVVIFLTGFNELIKKGIDIFVV